MIKISIIVPVYNTAEFLAQCLNSLVKQTISDFEIIVVNDGSTDTSLNIIEQYANRYPNLIKIISQDNVGLSGARNSGLNVASGEYIGFVDSDDYVETSMFELLYAKAMEKNFDVVDCNLKFIYKDKKKYVKSMIDQDLTDLVEVKRSMLNIFPAAWNKIIKRTMFHSGIQFTKGIWFEDFEFLYRLYPQIKNIGHVSQFLYFYRQNDNSITHQYDKRLYQYITNFHNIFSTYKSNGKFEEYRWELEYLFVRYAYATMIRRLAKTKDRKMYKSGVKFAIDQVRIYVPNRFENPLFYKMGFKGFYLLVFNRLVGSFVYYLENYWRYLIE